MEWGRWGRVLFDVGRCQGLLFLHCWGVAQLDGAPYTVCSTSTKSSWDLMQRCMTSLKAGTCPQKQYSSLWLQWSLYTSGQSELEMYVPVHIQRDTHSPFYLQATMVTASAEQLEVMNFLCSWLISWLCLDRGHPEGRSNTGPCGRN